MKQKIRAKNGEVKNFNTHGVVYFEGLLQDWGGIHDMKKYNFEYHAYDAVIAQRHGIQEAILLQHIGYFIHVNKKNGTGKAIGLTWSFSSVSKLKNKYFPEFSYDSLRRTLERLEANKIILKGNFNKSTVDHTTWYTILDPWVRDRMGLGQLVSFAIDGEQIDAVERIEPGSSFNSDMFYSVGTGASSQGGDALTLQSSNKPLNLKEILTNVSINDCTKVQSFRKQNQPSVVGGVAPMDDGVFANAHTPHPESLSLNETSSVQKGEDTLSEYNFKNKLTAKAPTRPVPATGKTKSIRLTEEEKMFLPVIHHWNNTVVEMKKDRDAGLCAPPKLMSHHKVDNSGYASSTVKKALGMMVRLSKEPFKAVFPDARVYSVGDIDPDNGDSPVSMKGFITLISMYSRAFYPKIYPVDKCLLQPTILGFMYTALANPKSNFGNKSWLWQVMNFQVKTVDMPNPELMVKFKQYYPEIMKKLERNVEINGEEVRSRLESFLGGVVQDWQKINSRIYMLYKDLGSKALVQLLSNPGDYVNELIDYASSMYDLKPGHFYHEGATYVSFKEYLKKKYKGSHYNLTFNPSKELRERLATKRWESMGCPAQAKHPAVEETLYTQADMDYLKAHPRLKPWWE